MQCHAYIKVLDQWSNLTFGTKPTISVKKKIWEIIIMLFLIFDFSQINWNLLMTGGANEVMLPCQLFEEIIRNKIIKIIIMSVGL